MAGSAAALAKPTAPYAARWSRKDKTVQDMTWPTKSHPFTPPVGAPSKPSPAPELAGKTFPSSTARAIAHAASLAPDEPLRLVLSLKDEGFDFAQLSGTSADTRAAAVVLRRVAIQPLQDLAASRLEALGAKVLDRHWIANQLVAEVPAKRVVTISAFAEVASLSLSGKAIPAGGYSGLETRSYTRAIDFSNYNLRGQWGGRAYSGARQMIGIIEALGPEIPNNISYFHPGWNDYGSGPVALVPTRLLGQYDCSSGPCTYTNANGRTAHLASIHGRTVASVAASALDEGQDATVTSSVEQLKRTGMAPEALLLYYQFSDWCDSATRAVEHAVANGADFINMSFFCLPSTAVNCDPAADYGGLNEALRNAIAAGVLPIAAAGNFGTQGGNSCTVSYPSHLQHVVSVGGLDTYVTSTPWSGTVRQSESATGPMPIVTHNGYSVVTNGVDIMAPYWVSHGHLDVSPADPANRYSLFEMGGTSFAAPIVTGAAALLKHALWEAGMNVYAQQPGYLFADLLLMGDGYQAGSAVESRDRMSPRSGAGRLRLHRPANADLVSPWSWGHTSMSVTQGTEHCFAPTGGAPMDPDVTEWKWTSTWFDDHLTDVSDIDFFVYDTCPSGGGARQLVAYDTGFNLRSRFRLTAPEITGKCLEACMYGFSVASATTVYVANYFHSGSTDEH